MRAFEFIREGIHDPAIFKVVFVIGGPGSGKSYITQQLGLSALGYVNINSDIAFEYLMKKHNIDPKMPPEEKEKRDVVRQRAKDITGDKSMLAIEGRLGIVIDGTGDEFEKVSKLKSNFDALGYNNFLVVVNTKLDVARERNQKRQRTVPDKIVVDSWYAVQNNIGKFAQIFEQMSVIDNSGDSATTNEQIQNTYKKLVKFTQQEPNKPIAKQWMNQQRPPTNEASYAGNLGMMEMFKFYQVASPEMKDLMRKLLAQGKEEAAWELLQKVTGVKLKEVAVDEAEEGTPESEEIVNRLTKAGYKQLGSGADATVWAKDEGRIIKIIMPDSEDITQPARVFKKFYEFCIQHKDLDCVPKFIPIQGKDYVEFTLGNKQYMQISMEQLYPIKNNTFEEGMVWYLSDFAVKGTDWNKIKQFLSSPKAWYDSDHFTKYANRFALNMSNMNKTVEAKYELLYTVMKYLYQTGRINKFGWDLHTENVMQRQDGTLVITDPWFEDNEESLNEVNNGYRWTSNELYRHLN